MGNVVVSLNENSSFKQREVLHSDALGSTVVVRSANDSQSGALDIKLQSMAFYDAFGHQTLLPVPTSSPLPQLNAAMQRGYTGHEMLNDLDIIHMNGRIFDPILARFVQADPIIQAPNYSQSFNRYSYVFNNPLNFTDPTGFISISKLVDPLLRPAIRLSVKLIGAELTNFFGAILHSWAAGPIGTAYWTYNFNRAMGVPMSGAIRASAVGFITSGITQNVAGWIGTNLPYANSMAGVYNVAAHGLLGGAMAELQGGNFGHGFISSAISTSIKSVMTPQQGSYSAAVGRTMISAIVGGTMSHLTGGSFANGAITSALQWWYNAEGNPSTLNDYLEKNGDVDYIDEDSAKILREAEVQRKFLTKYDDSKGNKWDSSETDCSGSLTNILHRAGLRDGYKNGRLSSGDINSKNGFIKVKELAPGDILVWRGHVAIYAGKGMIYTTSNKYSDFRLSKLDSRWGWGVAAGFKGAYTYVGN